MAGDAMTGTRTVNDAVAQGEGVDETTPLLESRSKSMYVTFGKCLEEEWKPSIGFWWIETGT